MRRAGQGVGVHEVAAGRGPRLGVDRPQGKSPRGRGGPPPPREGGRGGRGGRRGPLSDGAQRGREAEQGREVVQAVQAVQAHGVAGRRQEGVRVRQERVPMRVRLELKETGVNREHTPNYTAKTSSPSRVGSAQGKN